MAVPHKTDERLRKIIILLSLTFYQVYLNLIFSYFLDIQARVERWESESSESKDIELVEISADSAGMFLTRGSSLTQSTRQELICLSLLKMNTN